MFELFLSLCLAGPEDCRSVYVPTAGFEALEDCEAEASAREGEFADAEGSRLSCEPRPASALAFTEIADGVYAHEGTIADPSPESGADLSNIGFIVGDAGVLVVDSGGSYQTGAEIYFAVRAVTDLPIKGVVLTHMHPDHVYGAKVFEELGAPILGHPHLPEALASRADSYEENYLTRLGKAVTVDELPSAITPIAADGEAVDLGGRSVWVQPWATAHTNNDASVLDQQSGILFTGDLLFHEHTPAIDGSIRGWEEVMAAMRDFGDVTQLVPGHGAVPLPFPAGFDDQSRYFGVLVEDTKTAIDEGARMNDAVKTIAQSERENWLLFESFNPRNATLVFGELEWE